jgi:hypothetical protein
MAENSRRGSLHHLNNLFQVILGTLELLKRNRAASVETVDIALRATREASLLAQRLLGERIRPASDAPTDLDRLAYDLERLAAALRRETGPASPSAAASGTGLPKK